MEVFHESVVIGTLKLAEQFFYAVVSFPKKKKKKGKFSVTYGLRSSRIDPSQESEWGYLLYRYF